MKILFLFLRAAKMRTALFAAFVLMLLFQTSLQSQAKLYSEAPITFDNGVRKSTQLTVHFKYPVLNLPRGTSHATVSDLPSQFSQLKTYFNALRDRPLSPSPTLPYHPFSSLSSACIFHNTTVPFMILPS